MSDDALSLIRREWEDGNRRLEAERSDPRRYRTLVRQVELVIDELRKQVGQTFTLASSPTRTGTPTAGRAPPWRSGRRPAAGPATSSSCSPPRSTPTSAGRWTTSSDDDPRRPPAAPPAPLPASALWLGASSWRLLLFAVGVAVGEALHDNPTPGITKTVVRTLHP